MVKVNNITILDDDYTVNCLVPIKVLGEGKGRLIGNTVVLDESYVNNIDVEVLRTTTRVHIENGNIGTLILVSPRMVTLGKNVCVNKIVVLTDQPALFIGGRRQILNT